MFESTADTSLKTTPRSTCLLVMWDAISSRALVLTASSSIQISVDTMSEEGMLSNEDVPRYDITAATMYPSVTNSKKSSLALSHVPSIDQVTDLIQRSSLHT